MTTQQHEAVVTRCVLLTPTERYVRTLMRASSGGRICDLTKDVHEAERFVGAMRSKGPPEDGLGHHDPRWPSICDCGYMFEDDDDYVVEYRQLYSNAMTGETFMLDNVPVGAIWNAPWMPDSERGTDGQSLVISTSWGDVMLDEMRSDGTQRRRLGSAPQCTVLESLLELKEDERIRHSWLREGLLIEEE